MTRSRRFPSAPAPADRRAVLRLAAPSRGGRSRGGAERDRGRRRFITLGDLFDAGARRLAGCGGARHRRGARARRARRHRSCARRAPLPRPTGSCWRPLERVRYRHRDARQPRRSAPRRSSRACSMRIAERGMQGKFAHPLLGARAHARCRRHAEASVAVDSLDLDPVTGQFRAKLRAPAGDLRRPP